MYDTIHKNYDFNFLKQLQKVPFLQKPNIISLVWWLYIVCLPSDEIHSVQVLGMLNMKLST